MFANYISAILRGFPEISKLTPRAKGCAGGPPAGPVFYQQVCIMAAYAFSAKGRAGGPSGGPERYPQVSILATYVLPAKGRAVPRWTGVLSACFHPGDLRFLG